MAKKIFMAETDVEELIASMRTQLVGMKCYGAFSMKKTFAVDDRTAILRFTPEAWIKMTALVARFSTEVQWHGLVRRIAEDAFEVYDILNFPHEVSGATVISDQVKYNNWINNLDDEKFNALRFHGHSHVDMAVNPSSVDEKYRSDIVTQLPKPSEGEDVFYIFMIINKKYEISAEIYDFTNNALYGTKDITVLTQLGDSYLEAFVQEAKRLAVERVSTNCSKGGSYGGSYGGKSYGGYGGYYEKGNKGSESKVITSSKKSEDKKSKKEPGNGPCCGYDSWQEYYRSEYPEAYEDDYDDYSSYMR